MILLSKYIESKITVDQAMLQDIVDCFIIKKYKQNDTIVRVGQFVNEYFFIAEGSIRIVLETEEKDITAWLIFENNFFTDLESIKTGQGSKSKIVALEDTTLCLIHTSKMHQMYKKYPEWQEFGRLITEDALLNIIDTLVSFQVMDAQERYIRLLHKSDVIQRVPLKLLASYLGITPTSLSRIRKSVSTI